MPPDKVKKVLTTKDRKPRYFYGWNIVAASFLANLSYAETHTSMLGFFLKPLQNEFGWSRSALAAVHTIARVTEGLVAQVVGPLVDKYGPRVLMPIGGIVVGLTMLGVTQINAIWQFYLLRGIVVGIGFTFMGQLVTQITINNWFVKKRGRALAIAQIGANLSNIIFTPITVFVIATSGWRTMFVIFAVVAWLFVLIPSVIFMRRRPEDMGLHPDGVQPSIAEAKSKPEENEHPISEAASALEPIWSRREVLTTASFWLLTACFGIHAMASQGINISLAPYIQDLEYTDVTLTAVMTFRAIIMTVTLPLMGFIAEYAHKVTVRLMPFIIECVGAFLFLFAREPVFLWLAVAIYGLGFIALDVIQAVVWANYFGRFSLGLVRSLATMATLGFGATGPVAMNIAFDLVGSYRPAFVVIGGLFIMAAFIMGVVRPPQARRYATAAEIMTSARQ